MYFLKREGKNSLSEGINRVFLLKWGEYFDLVNGTWTVYQTDYKLTKHSVQPVKNKTEGLADIYCMPYFWKIP